MDDYAALADQVMSFMDRHPRVEPDSISSAIRGEISVLRLLTTEGKHLSAGAISKRLNMTTSRIAAVLNSLEKKNMIARTNDEKDRRRVLVSLTDKGKTYCQERRQEAKLHMTALLSQLGEEDARAFARILERIFGILSKLPPPCPPSANP